MEFEGAEPSEIIKASEVMIGFKDLSISAETLGWAATAATIGLFALGYFQLKAVTDYNKITIFPYVLQLLNCIGWTLYGLKLGDPAVVVTNGIGLVLAEYYLWILWGKKPSSHFFISLSFVAVSMFCFWAFFEPLGPAISTDYLGKAGVFFSFLLFSSPFLELFTICRSKSSASLNLPFVALASCTSSLWLLYGLLLHHHNIAFPNFLAFCICLAQWLLFFVFRSPPPPSHLSLPLR